MVTPIVFYTNIYQHAYQEVSTATWTLALSLLQFMRHATEALQCNGFVAGPVSLQLTGHPFTLGHGCKYNASVNFKTTTVSIVDYIFFRLCFQ